MNKEDKIFQIYLHLIKTDPERSAYEAADEAIDLYYCLEETIAEMDQAVELDKMIEEKKAVWDILNLTVRTGNCLKADGIYTLDELCQSKESRILSIPGLGRRSFNEIKEALAKIGRTIGEKRGARSGRFGITTSSTW